MDIRSPHALLIEIRDLVAKGSTADALEMILTFYETEEHPDYHKVAILLNNRYQSLRNEELQIGENHTVEKTKIAAQLLKLVDDFSKGKKIDNSMEGRKSNFNLWLMVGIPLVVLLIVLGILFIGNVTYETTGEQSPIIFGNDSKVEYNNSSIKDTVE